MCFLFSFFFSSRRRHTRSLRDWSSDVCSSDLQRCGDHRPGGWDGGAKETGVRGRNLWRNRAVRAGAPVVSPPPAHLSHHLPEPFPTTLSGSPWGGRVVGNGGGRPPKVVFAGRRDSGRDHVAHTGRTPRLAGVSSVCRRCVVVGWLPTVRLT